MMNEQSIISIYVDAPAVVPFMTTCRCRPTAQYDLNFNGLLKAFPWKLTFEPNSLRPYVDLSIVRARKLVKLFQWLQRLTSIIEINLDIRIPHSEQSIG